MLAPHEFSVGPVALASSMTLVLRRGAREASFLVTAATGEPTAIFLDGEHRFSFMPSAGNTDWSGILVPNVVVEVDETSILDANEGQPLGSIVRKHSLLLVRAKRDQRMGVTPIAIVADLPTCHENESVVFARWQIMLGEGLSKRVLFKVDALRND
jgi:hypothetical protein